MPYSEAQLEAQKRYQAKLASLSLRMPPELYDHYKAAAQAFGLSLRQFVLCALDEFIEHHKPK